MGKKRESVNNKEAWPNKRYTVISREVTCFHSASSEETEVGGSGIHDQPGLHNAELS